jgi:hypothetical protein
MKNSVIENCNSTDSLGLQAFVGTDAEKPQFYTFKGLPKINVKLGK